MRIGCDDGYFAESAGNFRQLADYINENLNDGRALIVQGDFNYKFKRRLKDDLYGNLLKPTGLRDVWAELENGGLYDQSAPGFKLDDPGDSLDRILYRSGKDLKLTPKAKTVPELVGENGETYTDHEPMQTEFRYKRIGRLPAPVDPVEPHAEKVSDLVFREIGWVFARLGQAFIGIAELPYLIYQGVEYLINGKMK